MRYLKEIYTDYTLLDVEATGNYADDEIVEIALLKVRNDLIVDSFLKRVKPKNRKMSEIASLMTGISDEDLRDKPFIDTYKQEIIDYIGDKPIIGHNIISFDIKHLQKDLNYEFTNDIVDTRYFAQSVLPKQESLKLSELAKKFDLKPSTHNAFDDCETTKQLYDLCVKTMLENEKNKVNGPEKPKRTFIIKEKLKASDFKPTVDYIDINNPLYEKRFVFTGEMESMTRNQAWQELVNLGALSSETVSSKTNYLVIGNNESVINKKSSKHRKADEIIAKGYDLKIINEEEFLNLLAKAKNI